MSISTQLPQVNIVNSKKNTQFSGSPCLIAFFSESQQYGVSILTLQNKRPTDHLLCYLDLLLMHKSKQIPVDGEGQGNLECCSPWGRKETDTTEQHNNNLTTVQVPLLSVRDHTESSINQWLLTECALHKLSPYFVHLCGGLQSSGKAKTYTWNSK